MKRLKKAFFILLLILTVGLFWTCIHKPGGSLEYDLLLKPYPSALLYVGGGEESSYNQRLLDGDFPSWLVNGNYVVLAWGSFESDLKPWELIRSATVVCVLVGWLAVIIWVLFKLTRLSIGYLKKALRPAKPGN